MNAREEKDSKTIWDQIKGQIDGSGSIEELNALLDKMHPSDCHVAIRDMISSNYSINKMVQQAGKDNIEQYQLFQDIKMKAKASFTHDRTSATMLDVDMAVSKAYKTLLSMIATLNKQVIESSEAIDKINEQLGVVSNNLDGSDKNDDAECSNEQGIEKDIN